MEYTVKIATRLTRLVGAAPVLRAFMSAYALCIWYNLIAMRTTRDSIMINIHIKGVKKCNSPSKHSTPTRRTRDSPGMRSLFWVCTVRTSFCYQDVETYESLHHVKIYSAVEEVSTARNDSDIWVCGSDLKLWPYSSYEYVRAQDSINLLQPWQR